MQFWDQKDFFFKEINMLSIQQVHIKLIMQMTEFIKYIFVTLYSSKNLEKMYYGFQENIQHNRFEHW